HGGDDARCGRGSLHDRNPARGERARPLRDVQRSRLPRSIPRVGAPDPGGRRRREGVSVNARAQGGSLAAGVELVHREARLLDEQRWDDWLALFVEDCEYWMPAWKADGTPTANPQAELSHIYYASRA